MYGNKVKLSQQVIDIEVITEIFYVCTLSFTLGLQNLGAVYSTLTPLGPATVQGAQEPGGPAATAQTARPSVHTPLCLSGLVCFCCTRRRSCLLQINTTLQGPALCVRPSGRSPSWSHAGPLERACTHRTWPGTERKQGHWHGSRALGQRRRVPRAIKVLTDKNCPLGHHAAMGRQVHFRIN